MAITFLTNEDEKNYIKTVNGSTPDENGNIEIDGFSPTATVEQTESGAVVSITDKDGTTTATISNGQRGRGILHVTREPYVWNDGEAPYRMPLKTIISQAGVNEVLVGDIVQHGCNQYKVLELNKDDRLAYLDNPVSIKGVDGTDGTNGKSAYEYAQEAGYTGTKTQFAKKLASDNGVSSWDALSDKPFYEMDTLFDGNTSGHEVVMFNESMSFVKMNDHVFTEEECIGKVASVYIEANDTVAELSVSANGIIDLADPDIGIPGFLIFPDELMTYEMPAVMIIKEPVSSDYISLSAGTYYAIVNSDSIGKGHTTYFSAFDDVVTLKKLDEKYLPDSVVQVEAVKKAVNPYFEGNIEGYTFLTFDVPNEEDGIGGFVKITDYILTEEECLGATVTFSSLGYSHNEVLTKKVDFTNTVGLPCDAYYTDDGSSTPYIVVIKSSGIGSEIIEGAEVSAGTYYLYMDTSGMDGGKTFITHFSALDNKEVVEEKINPKYLPSEVALKSDIPSIEGLASEEYVNDAIANLPTGGGGSSGNVDFVGVEPAEEDIPKVFFGGVLQQTKTEAVVPFRYISKTQDISGYAEIKAQGNSSMSYPKKNQTVKLFRDADCTEKLKIDFKGWGKQNKHVYKANWIDLSHARNVVSARLWADIVKSRANYAELPELFRTTPNQGAVDGFPVKVYAAGVYQGRYTLNIPKDKWAFNMDDELDEHCVLCGENYVSGCFRASANINGNDWTDEIHDTVPASIKTRWNEVISFVMNSTDEEFRANLNQYFYVDSLIDYYLFGLASCGLDAFGKNQIYATYNGQRWIASMYDMDSTWGLYWNGSKFVATDYARTSFEDMVQGRQGNLLYMRLEQLFSAELQTRWAELKSGALSIENIINRFERFTDIAPAELVKEDYATTTGGGKFTGIPSKDTNNIQQIRSFALERQVWTDEYVAALTPEVQISCTGITLDKGALTFNGTGTQTITATVTPDGCTDTMIWVSANPEIANINVGGDVCTVESVTNGSTTITVRCGNYSASCSVSVSGIPVPVPCTGIILDKNELMFNAEGTQIITATVTPTDTTDSVVWTSSNETVATVENGVVTAVASGTATITATCGGYSATCTVSVSIIVAPVYELAEATTFDGTNYIDTGVSPLAKQQDFTLLLEWEHTGESVWAGNSHVVMHCMHEVSPYPGMQLAYHANGFQMEARQKNAVIAFSVTKDGIATSDINTIRIAYKIDWSNRLITVSRRYNGSGEIYSNNATPTFVQIDENVLLGCYQTADGTTERYAKGIMRNCKIYTCALPDAEIEAWLNS